MSYLPSIYLIFLAGGKHRDKFGMIQPETISRPPISPITNLVEIIMIERNMPDGPLTARGRRKAFKHTFENSYKSQQESKVCNKEQGNKSTGMCTVDLCQGVVIFNAILYKATFLYSKEKVKFCIFRI